MQLLSLPLSHQTKSSSQAFDRKLMTLLLCSQFEGPVTREMFQLIIVVDAT